jgi:hypothetical protein
MEESCLYRKDTILKDNGIFWLLSRIIDRRHRHSLGSATYFSKRKKLLNKMLAEALRISEPLLSSLPELDT